MGFLSPIPPIILLLALALLLAGPFAFLAGRRGGRYRGLPGWIGFWVFFAGLLVCLSRAHAWISFPLLALLMFAALRQYFFLTPVRPGDRWALLAAYLSIPAALWPPLGEGNSAWYAALPVALFLSMPVLLSVGARREGLLDAMGRVMFGVLVFVFCAAHLGLMTGMPQGRLEFFGILAIVAELLQRLAGRIGSGVGFARAAAGLGASALAAAAVGAWVGPMAMVPSPHGPVTGVLVAGAVAAGRLVAGAVADDLDMAASSTVVGRAAFLDRTIPAIFAAPVVYHYLKSVL